MRIRTKSGGYRWMSIIGMPYPDPDGQPGGTVGRVRDIDDLVRAREAAEERLQSMVANLLDPLILLAPVRSSTGLVIDFTCTEANEAACTYASLTREQLVGARLLDLMPGHLANGGLDLLVSALETGDPVILDDFEYAQELKGGETRYYDLRIARAGERLVYTFRDQTERRAAEHEVADREELYRLVTEGVTDAVVRFDNQAIITWVSPSFERLTGFPASAVVGMSGMDLVNVEQADEAQALLDQRIRGELTEDMQVQLLCADGTRRWISSSSRPFVHANGTPDGFVSVLRDIDDTIKAQQRRDHEIGHDTLTGLANRELALARIDRALDDLGPNRRSLAVLSIGVDRLTTVNQALSYTAGDLVLTTIAGRIASAVGDPDRVARVAGDEFLVLMTDLPSAADAASKAERLCAAARGTITVAGQSLEPTVSIGIATGDRHSTSEELLRQASLAARRAKDAGRDRWQFIEPTLASEAARRLTIESDLRDVLRQQRLEPWFQPIVTLADRRVRGYEALARWTSADHVMMMPEEFLTVAEATGLVVDIDLAVLSGALDVLRVMSIDHVAVNVSPPSLATADFADRFSAIVRASGIDPARLRLEVTETALLDVSPAIAEAMVQMSASGATWYVDDFGTGFSSISHLRDLPVRGLKLDKSFTSGIRTGDATCIKLAQGLIGLASGLGLDTVAEGVETEFEAGALLGQGWNQGQGWLFGKPEPRAFAPD
jgi:diguanylate cyclase (GGDEF)-like protein/PAS domain S-box-containing protein